jgi:hypothetical protein
VKTLHFASILVLASSVAFVACGDDDDDVTPGASGAAGESGAAGSGAAGKSTGGSTTDAGAGGGASETQGGAGAGGVSGEGLGGVAGGAGEGGVGGAGGEGGAPEVPDVVVPGPTELVGTWTNNFGGTEVVTANTWNGANIVAYTSGVTTFYTHNLASDTYNPKKFSKWVYTQPANDSFYYCQVVFGAATLAAAQANTTVPDASDPDTGGCGGSFPWTKATKQQ